jgi:hypothetical protein
MEDSNRGGTEPAPIAAPEPQAPAGLPETVPPAPPAALAVEAGPEVSGFGRIPSPEPAQLPEPPWPGRGQSSSRHVKPIV